MPVPKPSNEDRRAASIEAVMNAARHHFVARGYHGTTMDRIAASAGLTKGSIYFYFSDKESLLLSLLDEVEAEFFDPIIDMLRDPDLTPQEKLVAFLHRQSVAGGENAEHLLLPVVMSKEPSGNGDRIAARIEALYGRLYEALEGMVEDGQRSGQFWRHAAPSEQASLIVAVHDGMLLEWLRRGKRNQLDGFDLVRALRLTMLKGLSRDAYEGPETGNVETFRASGS